MEKGGNPCEDYFVSSCLKNRPTAREVRNFVINYHDNNVNKLRIEDIKNKNIHLPRLEEYELTKCINNNYSTFNKVYTGKCRDVYEVVEDEK